MTLDDLNQVRQCLFESHNQIAGKITVSRDLMLETVEESMEIITQAILEAKHKGRIRADQEERQKNGREG